MRKLIILLLLTLLAFSGCKSKEMEEDYIARVNEEQLSIEEFKASFSESEWGSMDDRAKEKFVDEWVDLTLLAQECDRQGISELPIIQERIKHSVKKIKANTLIAAELRNLPTSEEELFSYYQLHKAEYRRENKEYKYQRIKVNSEDELSKITAKLRKGSKVKDLAIQYSKEAAGKNGGYMGFVSEKLVNAEFWAVLESLEQYNWKSLESGGAFYILRWYEKRELEIEMPFSDVRVEIEEKFRSENKQERYNSLKRKLDNASIIEKKYKF